MTKPGVTARLVVAALLFSGCVPAGPAGLLVEAVLRDGRAINGRTEAAAVPLTVVVAGADVAVLQLTAPEEWSSLETAGEVRWIPDRAVFCIRGASFTAEASEIRSSLAIRDEAGQPIELNWRDVSSARFSVR
jgi:hypothetical protein